MKVQVSLFGAFREFEPVGRIELDVADDADIAQLRAVLDAFAQRHWSGFRPALLASSAFASESAVLRDHERVPADGRVAVLPPVSGG
jgi:molybdopterin synthase sulfur carrier subunit